MNANGKDRTVAAAMTIGASRFAVVSVSGFSVWALAGKWLHARIGEGGVFAACAVVFLGLSGLLLHPLAQGPSRMTRFYAVFVPAFAAYAVAWSFAWFVFHFGLGEWLASLAGSVAFVGVARWRLGNTGSVLKACLIVFLAHSLGYFLGAKMMGWIAGAEVAGASGTSLSLVGKLVWGLAYGAGFGAGIGYTFAAFQKPITLSRNNDGSQPGAAAEGRGAAKPV